MYARCNTSATPRELRRATTELCSTGDLLWCFETDHLGGGFHPVYEEGFRLDWEDHPGLATRVARPDQAQGALDTFGPYRGPEAGLPATNLDRHPNHSDSFQVTSAVLA